MYDRQMLCFVLRTTLPLAQSAKQALDGEATRQALDTLFKKLKFVHFASVALLPGHADDPTPSLMLELAVDDGLAPDEVVKRLVAKGLEALRPLAFGPTSLNADDGKARDELEARLRSALADAPAAGGFIGMRDRTAAQIREEALYFLQTRKLMRQLRSAQPPGAPPPTAAQWVSRLLDAMATDPSRPALGAPPPTSFWCRPRPAPLQLLFAVLWVGLPVPALVMVLAGLGALVSMVVQAQPALFGQAPGWTGAAVAGLALLAATGAVLWMLFRLHLAIGILALAVSVLGVAWLHAVLLQHAFGLLQALWPLPALPPPVAAGLAGACLLALVLAGLVAGSLSPAWRRRWARAGTRAGAAVLALGLVLLVLDTPAVNPATPLTALLVLLPAGALAALLLRRRVLRWWAALLWAVLPLVLALVLLMAAAGFGETRLWVNPASLLSHTVFGALSLLALLAFAGIVVALSALAALRRPLWPLAPLLLGAVLLASVVALLAGAVGQALYLALAPGSRPAPGAAAGALAYAVPWLAACGVAVLLLFVLRGVADRALPALARLERRHDRPPNPAADHVPHDVHEDILAGEARLFARPNHMINLSDVRGRPGGLPTLMLRLWLNIVGDAGHAWFTRGRLGSAWGIKFGHWHLIDGGRRLLFVSNFDFDFGGYLDEFIRGTPLGINMIWRWTELRERPAAVPGQPGVDRPRRFPPTYRWGFRGCQQELHFKAYARAGMVPHLYLYQAYTLASTEIRAATRLRQLMSGPRTAASDDEVMRILAS